MDGPDSATPPYNQQLLTNCASAVDFVVIHYYPGGTEAALLQAPLSIPAMVTATRTEIQADIPNRYQNIEILVTETGAGSVQGTAMGLFAADDYATWFENGISNVDYQELHNYDSAYGFLTDGVTGDAGVIANDSPLGPAYASLLVSKLAAAGDMFVTTTSSSTLVAVHATKKANGHYAVMLINKDPANVRTITVTATGATFAACGTRTDFGVGNFTGLYPSSAPKTSSMSGISPTSFAISIPAYTISLVDIAP